MQLVIKDKQFKFQLSLVISDSVLTKKLMKLNLNTTFHNRKQLYSN